jgi:hypothetical protein
VDAKLVDAQLAAKWKKQGFEAKQINFNLFIYSFFLIKNHQKFSISAASDASRPGTPISAPTAFAVSQSRRWTRFFCDKNFKKK